MVCATSWELIGMVALLAEGVDRNRLLVEIAHSGLVALLAEGVDRNSKTDRGRYQKTGSPSSRRAWIEIGWS